MKLPRTFSFVWFVCFTFGCGAMLLAIQLYELNWIRTEKKSEIHISENSPKNKPVYIVYGHNVDSGYLENVFDTFDAFGFIRGTLDSDDWDVFWAHDYPFRKFSEKMKHLKKNQKVNHFPGTGYITNKLDLVKTNSPYIPKAFQMPQQKEAFLKHAFENPSKMFVQKSNNHRGIKIKNVKNLDLKSEETFIQEFVDNPLLVDGYKFDIGIYTIITSIEPLKVYMYNGDILFRFCPEKYHPFDPKNKNKYVIGDDYLPIWEVPSLKKYFLGGTYSMRDSFNAHLRSIGRNPEHIWTKIEEAIRDIILKKEPSLLQSVKKYPSKRNFFEMVRFDFAVNDNLEVFTMEANMSPNLSSTHFPPNKLLYYQVLFNLFSLAGLGNYNRSFKTNMEVSLKNLMVYADQCTSEQCNSCFPSDCQLCLKCLSQESIEYLKSSYIEHNNRHDCKRIFPPSPINVYTNVTAIHDLSPDNQLLWKWFEGKCILNQKWC